MTELDKFLGALISIAQPYTIEDNGKVVTVYTKGLEYWYNSLTGEYIDYSGAYR